MDYQTLISYGDVEITVTRAGHGLTPGVYKVGEGGITAARALAILKDKKAQIKINDETVSKEQIEDKGSDVNSEPVVATTSSKTGQRRTRRSKRRKTIKTGEHRVAGGEGSTIGDVGGGESKSRSESEEAGTSADSSSD